MTDAPIGTELLAALRAGQRFKHLLQNLDLDQIERLLKRARRPVRANASNRERLLRQKAWQLLPRMAKDGPATDVLLQWVAPRMHFLQQFLLEPDNTLTWKHGLLARVAFGVGVSRLPSLMASRIDDLISDRVPALGDGEQRGVCQVLRSLEMERRLEFFLRRVESAVAGAPGDTLIHSADGERSALEALTAGLRTADWLSGLVDAWEPDLTELSRLAGHLDVPFPLSSAREQLAAVVDVSSHDALRRALVDMREPLVAAFDRTQGLQRVRRLVERLAARAGELDGERLRAELTRFEASDSVEAGGAGALLSALVDLQTGRRTFDDVAPILGSQLTYNLVDDLRRNGLPAAVDGPAESAGVAESAVEPSEGERPPEGEPTAAHAGVGADGEASRSTGPALTLPVEDVDAVHGSEASPAGEGDGSRGDEVGTIPEKPAAEGASPDGSGPLFDEEGEAQVDADLPEVDAEQPEVDAEQPEVDADQPEVDADPPEVDADQPEVDAGQPEIDAGQPEVVAPPNRGPISAVPETEPTPDADGVANAVSIEALEPDEEPEGALGSTDPAVDAAAVSTVPVADAVSQPTPEPSVSPHVEPDPPVEGIDPVVVPHREVSADVDGQLCDSPGSTSETSADAGHAAGSVDGPEGSDGDGGSAQLFVISGHLSSAQLAEALLAAPTARRLQDLQLLIHRLLLEERLDEAYWLARASQAPESLSFQLVDALHLGVNLQPGFRAAEARLLELFSEALPNQGELDRASALVLSAALIRPALMASATTEPTFLLEQLPHSLNFLPAMHRFVEALTDFSKRRQTMSPALFAGLRSRVEWEERKARLEKETECWLEESPNRKVKYDAATRVWNTWVRPTGGGGDLRRLVSETQSGDFDAEALRDRVRDWAGDTSFTRRLDQADRAINRRARRQPIKYGARDALKRLVDSALELVEEWIELHESGPISATGGDEIGQETLARLEDPAAELAERLVELTADSHPLALRAGAHWSRIVMLEVAESFASGSMRQSVDDPRHARRAWLHWVPGIGSEASFEALGPGEQRTAALLRFIARPLAPVEALHAHLDNGHIQAARALLRLVEQGGEPRGDLSDAIQSKQRWWLEHAHETLVTCLDEIEGYHLKGGLSLTQREDFNAEVEFLLRKLEGRDEGPRELLDELSAVRRRIEESVAEHRHQTEAQRIRLLELLEAEGREMPPDAQVLLDQAFAEDDLSVAIDLIARCRKGRSLQPLSYRPSQSHLEAFISAFPAIHALALDPRQAQQRLLGAHVESESGPFESVSPALREQAKSALASWLRLADVRRIKRPRDRLFGDLGVVLRWLGYHEADSGEPKVTERQPGSPAWLHLEVEARLVSPLPRFGSRAGGLHDVLIVWGQASAEQIAQRIAEARTLDRERAIALIVMRALEVLERRELIHAVRRKRFCPLVIDACLFTWLCGHDAEARREALFAVGLAGGYENPYTPTVAGGVPPEIFVGRQQDIERLWDRSGTCIVYGGRQLGKSALLRQVIRLYDRPEAEQFVFYEGTKNDAQVWEVVRRLLVRGKLLNKRTTNPHSIKDAIREQLEENPRRRILLLLDECDDLLDADMRNNFEGVALLRDLMTATDRRFKVVFAGLHNVQRFQRIPNQPLAHFGEPLCVGPLEPRAALELVERPLSVLGYRFEAPTLSQRILAHTNCHPSLLQLFCFSLVNELTRGRRPVAGTPPILIRERDITAVYRSVDLGRKMRLRFDWTLNLDERYRAIGYAFAFQELNNAFTGEQRDGFSAAAALADVSHWWPSGFAQTDQDELEGLLDEMVGLGVLVKHGHRYRLRSPNILRLLGGPEDIAGELDRFQRIEPRREPDRHVIHRVLHGTSRGVETSPLTLAQENRLLERAHGVDLVIGSEATRLAGVRNALQYLYGQRATDEALARPVIRLHGSDADTLLEQVKDHYRRQAGVTGLSLFIEASAALSSESEDGLERIVDWIEKLRTTERFVRVVVCIGPSELFALHSAGRLEALEQRAVVSTYRLRRWRAPGLERYYNDAGINPPVRIDELMERTGGWPCIVESLAQFAEKEPVVDNWPDPPLARLAGIDAIHHGRELLLLLSELSEASDPMSVEMLDLMAEDIESTEVRAFALCALDLSIVDGTIEELVAERLLGISTDRQ